MKGGYKYRSIFPEELNCSASLREAHCLPTGIDVPFLFTYRNSKMVWDQVSEGIAKVVLSKGHAPQTLLQA